MNGLRRVFYCVDLAWPCLPEAFGQKWLDELDELFEARSLKNGTWKTLLIEQVQRMTDGWRTGDIRY